MNFGSNWILALGSSIFKKNLAHTSAVVEGTALVWHIQTRLFSMCQFLLFLHSLSHFSTQFLKNCGGMLYFPSRLYNRVCIFSTFYRGWIHGGWTTALVSLIQLRLNVFFLLVQPSLYLTSWFQTLFIHVNNFLKNLHIK